MQITVGVNTRNCYTLHSTLLLVEGMEVIEVGDEDVDGGGDDDDDSYLQFFLFVEFLLNLTMCYIYYLTCLYKQCEKINTLFSTEEGTEYIR